MSTDAPRLRVVIGDDEPLSRLRLRQLVVGSRSFDLVAECASGPETLTAIRRARPAVVYLDVQMPGLDGFEVLGALGGEEPAVVFVTAFDQYAVRAFDVHAADYLLKPFDAVRFERSIARVRAHLAVSRPATRAVGAVRIALASTGNSEPRVAIRDGDAMRFLDVGAISHITAEDCYARIHTPARTYLVREALASLAARLPAQWFRRVHRSTIVNVAFLELIEPLSHGDLRLRLTGGGEFRVSRRYRDAVAALLDR